MKIELYRHHPAKSGKSYGRTTDKTLIEGPSSLSWSHCEAQGESINLRIERETPEGIKESFYVSLTRYELTEAKLFADRALADAKERRDVEARYKAAHPEAVR